MGQEAWLVQLALEPLVQSLVVAAVQSPVVAAESRFVVGLLVGSPCDGPYNTKPSCLHPTAPLHPLHNCMDRLQGQDEEAEDEAEDEALVAVVALVGVRLVVELVVVSVVPLVW